MHVVFIVQDVHDIPLYHLVLRVLREGVGSGAAGIGLWVIVFLKWERNGLAAQQVLNNFICVILLAHLE